MGNEVEGDDKRKILTNKSSFNQSNCREIQDSDSEVGSKENIKKGLSKQMLSDSNKEEDEDEDEMELSNNNIDNKDSNNNIEQNYVDYTFVWKEGGTLVKIVGSFNKWKEQIVMDKDPLDNSFKYKLRLKRDKYEYKFIVDNVWKCSRQQAVKADERGNANNFIDLTNYKLSKNNIKNSKTKKKKKKVKKIKKEEKEEKKEKDDNFTVELPKKEELNSEAPATQELYLNSFKINNPTNQKNVGEPQYYKYNNRESFTEEKSYKNLLYSPHVNLNHTLTFCEKKQILQVGLTYRFRNKDCTTIYYSRLNS